MNAIQLVDGQRVRTADSTWVTRIFVSSVEGFYRTNPDCGTIEEGIARAIANGHDLASTYNPGSTITADYPGKHEEIEAEKVAHETYQILANGDVVEIENRMYTVKMMGLKFSDPIHFIAQ
jgi:hypothetical protein